MNVILYMAMTVNGLVAKSNDDVSFVSPESWESYRVVVARASNVIVGRRTYELMKSGGDLDGLKNVKVVVVSHDNPPISDSNHRVVHSPQEALEVLKDAKEVVVVGGGMLNAAFLAENLVDELYLDVEPVLLGKGIPLFSGADFERRLQFLGAKGLHEHGIQLHYKVIK